MKTRFVISEDYVVSLIGVASILLIFFFINNLSIGFNWQNLNELKHQLVNKQLISHTLLPLVYIVLSCLVIALLINKKIIPYLGYSLLVLALSLVSVIISGNQVLKNYNIEPVIISLAVGLIIGNFIPFKASFRASFSGELFVKIGLVVLGSTLIFSDLYKAGLLGIVQALLVVITVWYFAFWLSKKLNLDSELTIMLSSAVSICGISAAIASAGVIKSNSQKLSTIVSLVLLTAIPMMLGMPFLVKWLNLSQITAGAWLGGTIDTTGAVVATGSQIGEEALKIATVVKFSQNILLGVAAFAISIYWCMHHKTDKANSKINWHILWDRFPKFVIAFLLVSVVCSFFVSPTILSESKNGIKAIQNLWFTMAFTSIGLESNIKEFIKNYNAKIFLAFITAQIFNILFTLFVSVIIFGW